MPRKHPYVSRRSATPQFGCAKQRKQNPGAKTRRGNEGVLFDECHVETNTCRKGTGGATAPLLRAAHGRLRLWRRCSDTNCQRERSCCGDADRCGARIAPQSWQWLRHVLRGILEGQPHEVAVKAANLARLPYRERRILRWPGVPCWDPVEYVQLHNRSWRHIDQVPLPPPLDPQFERLVASPWVRDARAADVRTDVRGDAKV